MTNQEKITPTYLILPLFCLVVLLQTGRKPSAHVWASLWESIQLKPWVSTKKTVLCYGVPSQLNRWVLSTCYLTPRASLGLAMWCHNTWLLWFGWLKVWQNLTQTFQTTYGHLPIPYHTLTLQIRSSAPNLSPLTNLRWALKCDNQAKGALPWYVPATYPIKSKPDALCSSYRMPGPSSKLSQLQGSTKPSLQKIAESYKVLLADPSLVQSFPLDEWTSVVELPCLHNLHFQVVSEGLFAKLITPWSVGPSLSQFHHLLQ